MSFFQKIFEISWKVVTEYGSNSQFCAGLDIPEGRGGETEAVVAQPQLGVQHLRPTQQVHQVTSCGRG